MTLGLRESDVLSILQGGFSAETSLLAGSALVEAWTNRLVLDLSLIFPDLFAQLLQSQSLTITAIAYPTRESSRVPNKP